MRPTPHPVQALPRLLQRVFSSDPPVVKEVLVDQTSRKVPAFSLGNKDLWVRTVLNAEQSRPVAETGLKPCSTGTVCRLWQWWHRALALSYPYRSASTG